MVPSREWRVRWQRGVAGHSCRLTLVYFDRSAHHRLHIAWKWSKSVFRYRDRHVFYLAQTKDGWIYSVIFHGVAYVKVWLDSGLWEKGEPHGGARKTGGDPVREMQEARVE